MIRNKVTLTAAVLITVLFLNIPSYAESTTLEDEGIKDKTALQQAEALYIKNHRPVPRAAPQITLGITQGFDSNVNLNYSKKTDSYTEESLDIRHTFALVPRTTNLKLKFFADNQSYYNITDVDIFDGVGEVILEHKLADRLILIGGYALEELWYPNDERSTYISNEFSGGLRHFFTKRVYEKALYKYLIKNYVHRKRRLGSAVYTSDLREDLRHTFEHELGIYIFDTTKLKIMNRFVMNDSNDQYYDYYTYNQYKFGVSAAHMLTKKLYVLGSFSFLRKLYEGRLTSDDGKSQKDSLYIASGTVMYNLTKSVSLYGSYSYRENSTNEPLDKYVDNIYSGGIYYSF